MSTPSEQTASSGVRSLTRWGIPFHYVPLVVVAAIGIVMLRAGGTVGIFGGWWLAAALPISIGAFLRSPVFAAIPLIVWIGWLIHVDGASPEAALSHTPWLLGICLGLIGAGATVLAQRAVFPATAPDAWEASAGRLVPPLDDGEPVELEEHGPDHTLEFIVVEPIEASDEEIEAAALARVEEATAAEVPVGAEARALAKEQAEAAKLETKAAKQAAVEAKREAKAEKKAAAAVRKAEAAEARAAAAEEQAEAAKLAAEERAEKEAADKAASEALAVEEAAKAAEAAKAGAAKADAEASSTHETKVDITKPVAKADATESAGDPAEPDAKLDDAGADEDAESAVAASASSEAEAASKQDETEAEVAAPVAELPLDADPAPLDEGGHVAEFKAISAADLAATPDAAEDSGDQAEGKQQDAANEPTEPQAEAGGSSESKLDGDLAADADDDADLDETPDDQDAVTAGGGDAPLHAATQAGRRRGRKNR